MAKKRTNSKKSIGDKAIAEKYLPYRNCETLDEAQEVFEEFRDQVRREIPDEDKERWGTIGIAKFSGQWYPALIMDPFCCPPGARDEWLKGYKNVRG